MTLLPDDLDTSVDPRERAALNRVAARLEDERPLPAAAFRGDLRRRLEAPAGGSRLSERARRRLARGYLIAGGALLGLAAVGLVGAGPLAPDSAAEAIAWIVSAG